MKKILLFVVMMFFVFLMITGVKIIDAVDAKIKQSKACTYTKQEIQEMCDDFYLVPSLNDSKDLYT